MNLFRRIFGSYPPQPTFPPLTPPSITPPHAADQTAPTVLSRTTVASDETPETQELLAAVQAFIQAPMEQMRAMLHATPLLLMPAAITLLTDLAEQTKAEQPELSQVFVSIAALLEMAQLVDIDAAMDVAEGDDEASM